MSSTIPTPIIGWPLPRAGDAYADPEKLEWVLAERGHGREWARVLRVGRDDAGRLWGAIAWAVLDAPVSAIRDLSPFGVGCEVRAVITLNARTARVLTAWHYESAGDAPRLLSAYPTP
ncbi:MAG TPA: hypothetical protein VGX16_07060 [Solirubrobacteraceae bacterium]|nr:hypothetical protein [Solirubrobacteraceae bacterium]